jgi:hypothetical protein
MPLLLLLITLMFPPARSGPVRAQPAVDEVSLRRIPSGAAAAADELTLRADGTATYLGIRGVARMGEYRGLFPAAQFRSIMDRVRSGGFFKMKSYYSARRTDLTMRTVTVVSAGKQGRVTEAGGAPKALLEIEKEIMKVADGVRWQRPAATPTRSSDSGIRGQARLGPVVPVARPGEAGDRPYPEAVIVVRSAGGKEVARVRVDRDGKFQIPLAPGTYTVSGQGPNPRSPLPRGPESAVTVRVGRFTDVKMDFDSGIR